MKYGISLVLLMAVFIAGCAQQPDSAPVTSWGSDPNPTQIQVVRGDTLFGLAHRYNLPVKLIIDANHLSSPYRLDIGQTLVIPSQDAPMNAYAPPKHPPVRYAAQNAAYPAAPQRKPAESAPRASSARIESDEVPPAETAAEPRAFVPAVAGPTRAYPSQAFAAPPPPAIKPAAAVIVPPVASAPPGQASSRGFIWPVRGRVVEGFGASSNGTHNDGINIAARAGSAVYAAQAGEVVYVGNELRGYGNLVLIKHSGGYLSAYAHNSTLLVHKGEHVNRGQTIARVGATGQVGEPQLHFEIRAGRNPVNPTEFLPPIQQASIGE